MNDFIFAVILAGVAAILFYLAYLLFYKPYITRKEYRSPRVVKDGQGVERVRGEGARSCPVCGERLATGMQVKSKIITMGPTERMMHVYGCAYCWPENTAYERRCPVCERILPRDGFLVARYFEDRLKKHVHVLGCSGCRRVPGAPKAP